MATTHSKTEPTGKRITKTDLNQLAQSCYGEEACCEHIRSGKRGWYLHNGSEQTFIGANATEAFNYLQSQENVRDTSASEAVVTPEPPATPSSDAETTMGPEVATVVSTTPVATQTSAAATNVSATPVEVATAVPATPKVATAVSTTPVATQTPAAKTNVSATPAEVATAAPTTPKVATAVSTAPVATQTPAAKTNVSATPAEVATAAPTTPKVGTAVSTTPVATQTPAAKTNVLATPAEVATAAPTTPEVATAVSTTPVATQTPATPAATNVSATPAEVATAAPTTPEVATAVSTAQVATQTPATPAATNVSATPAELPKKPPISPEELLEIILEKFPKTFFRDPEKIRPVQKYIHKKIRRALNNEYAKDEISAALTLYTQTLEYCKKLILGGPRIDLEGNPCEEQVAQQHIEDAKARIAGEKPMRPANKKKPKKPLVQLPPPKLDQLVLGSMELCVKINELPADSKTLRNGWEEFIIDTKGQMVKITVRPKTWKKLQKASNEYPLWIANIRGKMGARTKFGFELVMPGIQIFEKQPRESQPKAEDNELTEKTI